MRLWRRKRIFDPRSFRELLIEPTSKCALACSRCDRTMFPERFRATELPLELLRERLNPRWLKQISTFHLNGTYGDPIFHTQFHELISLLRSHGANVKIETSGYGQKRAWWSGLRERLDRRDRLTFSIDGLQDTNHLYRKNAKWENIMDAVDAVRGTPTLIWKFIVFRHNQHQIEDARKLAQAVGFDEFRLVRSNRFGPYWHDQESDPMQPSSEHLGARFLRIDRGISVAEEIEPRCLESARLPCISYDGHLFPCCWMVSHFQDEKAFYEGKMEKVSLFSNTLDEAFRAPVMRQLADSFGTYSCAPGVCQQLCRKADVVKKTAFTQNSETTETLR